MDCKWGPCGQSSRRPHINPACLTHMETNIYPTWVHKGPTWLDAEGMSFFFIYHSLSTTEPGKLFLFMKTIEHTHTKFTHTRGWRGHLAWQHSLTPYLFSEDKWPRDTQKQNTARLIQRLTARHGAKISAQLNIDYRGSMQNNWAILNRLLNHAECAEGSRKVIIWYL